MKYQAMNNNRHHDDRSVRKALLRICALITGLTILTGCGTTSSNVTETHIEASQSAAEGTLTQSAASSAPDEVAPLNLASALSVPTQITKIG